ncbi:regulator [Streptomyces eurocidicus]|uniref:Regulator n=1 Tax=Streptomyces eurocidicus TaxID=66423 RepID=A0A2N8NV46_STREU|nr:winged helix-turn-helix domain-containing protein [Streptomyces eurocidicus]MBB5120263.1 DNA-binding transcriptional ArsR family regulator [Streptomyces eurocidicus]MBF6056057.1 helix-turn-helix domain-containing protein [Streptomyces eurocidicus]PNE32658.1 regulator [Streptomyces eurocidicus]
MIRIHFTADDFARVRFAPRPSPLPETHAALMMLGTRHEELLFGRWRNRLLRSLPGAVRPLADLVPDGVPPAFLDVLGDTPDEGLALIRSARPEFVRAGIEQVYAERTAPPWIRGLHGGQDEAWRVFVRAQRAAYESVLAPVWPLVQDLHRAEFTRHALALAEQGLGAALAGLAPGSRLCDGVWEWPVPGARGVREVRLGGRGLILRPTFHWRHGPLVQDLPDRPVALAYPAGRGLPPVPDGGDGPPDEALAGVLGRTRLAMLRCLDEARTTTGLARRTGVSNATASAHASALRAAGLLTTTRTGRSVHHVRTPLAELLLAGG